ncbi:G-box binding, MFMR [Cynara cardunculus var. scolymus]|uniref:G-box binding, MFMR n=1 Tax=Cynara cardunculus var. scolymus TaxID=59895 RepID=A0A118JU28_CYNCS|nr:G-box binding, MFMR [Cynara cardunculus var. scolymus]
MGFGASFVACCVTLCWLCSLKGIQSTDNSTLRSLDDIFQVYAQSSLPRRPRTGVLYNASLPSNFTGIEVSIVRLRRGSFWAKGANYSSFRLPPKIFTEPYSTRLDIVYSDLGNESSHYYSVPNYTLVAPVVGFNIYGSRNSTGQIGNFTTPVTKLNLTLVGGPILVQFPKISLPQNEKPKCVRFYLDGTVEMTNMTLQNMCIVQDQGHFSIVIRTSPPIQQAPKENKERVKGLWKWWAMGFVSPSSGVWSCYIDMLVVLQLSDRLMGIHEEEKPCKPEKSSSPPTEQEQQQQQTNVHVYPDWMAMQAYYGPRMAVPPYFNSALAAGHGPPPYMWGPPQHMMPPYAAFYPHGGVYAHPGVHLATSPLNVDSPAKSSGDSDRGLMKKLKGFDGLAMSIGNGNGDGAEGGNDNGISHSGETEGSSEGSDGNTTEGGQVGRKRSHEGSPILPAVGKSETHSGELLSTGADGTSSKTSGVAVASAKVSGKAGGVLSANPITELNLKNSPTAAANMTSSFVPLIPNENLLQAEAEELAVKVEALNNENLTLRGVMEDPRCNKGSGSSLSTANLLSRVDNSSGCVVRNEGESEVNKDPDSGAKLRQLLDSSPRADAVAAG